MIPNTCHVSVCVCTYKRPQLLLRLLEELSRQETDGRFSYSIVVADNDHLRSAEAVVEDFASRSRIAITYCVEPQQNIALTRNKAMENASGDFIAFIDDDEFPIPRWLLTLFQACERYQADGAIGPVMRHFDEKPPAWVLKGNFYQRATYTTGTVLDWSMGRTNNLLFKRRIISAGSQPFRPEFRTGEDQDFFRRMIQAKAVFVWSNEAVVYEVVPPVRWKRSFMLRRALLQGATTVLHPTFGARDILKSLIAIPAYLAALPFTLLWAHHRFMALLIKLCDHIGRLLALMKINPVKEPYVTD
ncbi:MAG TPA: glycosyltransferase [Terriglobales bacterium]|nr:glycosyltransferase [Terriglobales bacterium]